MTRIALIFLVCTAATAHAEHRSERVDASLARLGTLSEAELDVLSPHLDHGPVVLTEFRNRQTDLPAVIYAARIAAPAQTVASVIAHPQEYPSFMGALESVKITSVRGNMKSFDWTWGVALFSLTGQNVLTTFPGDPKRGYRYEIRTTSGELGIGRVVWRIRPDGPTRSVVVFASRLDMRNANYVTRQLAAEGNAINRTINVAVAAVTLLDVKAEAERRSGLVPARTTPVTPLARPHVDMRALGKLLRRGDLVLLDLDGASLRQVSVVGRAGSTVGRVRQVMTDPELFGHSRRHGNCTKVIDRTEQGLRFSWEIPIPLLHVGGEMMLRPSPNVIAVDGISGTLHQGQWRFDTYRYPGGEAGVIGWATFDPTDSPRLVRNLIAGNTQFSHGFVVATQLAVMRSIRSHVRRLGRVSRASR